MNPRLALIILILTGGCGQEHDARAILQGSGTSGKDHAESGPRTPNESSGLSGDWRGSIGTLAGSPASLEGWTIVSIERDTGMSRAGTIDAVGSFRLQRLRRDQAHTLVLLSRDDTVASVLSMPTTLSSLIKQFFVARDVTLPPLARDGQTLRFTSDDGIVPTNDLAQDGNNDGVPDGAAALLLLDRHGIDTDLDGRPNERDPDIDGDGVVNWIDSDDDGDGQRDPVDRDQNGDLEDDIQPGQEDSDRHFKDGVAYVDIAVDAVSQPDGSGVALTLRFRARVRDDVMPSAVEVRTSPSLLTGSSLATGHPASSTWDRRLVDDGSEADGAAGDGVFGANVALAPGRVPRPHQMVLFQLEFGDAEGTWHLAFPFTFPSVSLAPISGQYDPQNRSALLIGEPFSPSSSDFTWRAEVLGPDGDAVAWTSPSQPSTTRQLVIPANVLAGGRTHLYRLVAETRVTASGLPGYTVRSPIYELE